MARVLSIKIDSEMHGHQIGYILEKYLKLSSSLIKRLKRAEDGIVLNGVHASVVAKVKDGDVLVVNIKGRESQNIIPVDIPLDILWEDEDILVVNKPGTMPVHPSRNHITDTLANAVMHYLGNGESLHIITRLDRETSGVVLFAKNPRIAALLAEEIKNGKIKKEYIAIVNGDLESDEGRIHAAIKRKESIGITRCVAEDGKDALTQYKVIKKVNNLSLVRLFPLTGRTHQLRVHMSHIGHPIYGDIMYGASQENERTRLHCQKISFVHPETDKEVSFCASTPEDFNNLV